MGTDIHLQAEIRTNGVWTKVPNPNNRRCYFDDRNYALFGILAGVRWTDMGTIAHPRGLPADLSFRDDHDYDDETESGYEDYERRGVDLGEHSQSWLTLRELYAWDWGQTVTESIPVSVETYYQQDGYFDQKPPYHVGRGPKVDDTAMLILIEHLKKQYQGQDFWKALKERPEWTEIDYESTLAELAGIFYTRTMPTLYHLCEGRLDDCRIVFGFDS